MHHMETIKDYGVRKLAREMFLSAAAVSRWAQNNKIPAERVLQVERITGIPKEKLRPDLYK